jgi:hypothetical protein
MVEIRIDTDKDPPRVVQDGKAVYILGKDEDTTVHIGGGAPAILQLPYTTAVVRQVAVDQYGHGTTVTVRTADYGADALRVVTTLQPQEAATFVFASGYWQRR